MPRMLVELLLALIVSATMSAQTRSGVGQLQVSATVGSSSQLFEQPDGSFQLVVANAPSQADGRDLLLATNRLYANPSNRPLPDTITVALVSPAEPSNHKRDQRH